MVDKLEFTGERFTPECEREIWYEHIHRYAFAARLCQGARVLDAACGEGYGSALLAREAKAVTGLDIDEPVIEHAARRYASQENLEFISADCTQLPFPDDSFDVVVSFETIEHLSAQETLLAGFARVLKPDGFLMLSCPDKAEYSDQRDFQNEYHVRELYREELEQLISNEFAACSILGQKLMFHSAIWEMGEINQINLQTEMHDGKISNGNIPHSPMYFIALCAAAEEFLPRVSGSLNLFDDSDESVYTHYHHEIRKNMAAGGILAERDAQLKALKDQTQGKSWWQRLLGRD